MLLVQFFELFKSGIISHINLLFHSHQVILRMFRTVRNVLFERLFPNLKEQHYMFHIFKQLQIVLSKQTVHDILLTESSFAFSSLFKRGNLFISFTAFCMLALIFVSIFFYSPILNCSLKFLKHINFKLLESFSEETRNVLHVTGLLIVIRI